MSRKKKRSERKRRKPRPTYPARFALGDRLRVITGIPDPDFEDIPLGGWAGTVGQVDRRSSPPTYLIEWDQHTLDSMHPVFSKRCERDGLEVESMWLGENDLEPDTGEPAAIEQPTALRTLPLRPDDQDDRIRAIFGLTSDDPLPPANEENLRRYHRYLATHLSFPFPATYTVEPGPFQSREYRVTVTDLLGPGDGDEEDGVLCEADQQGEVVVLPLAVLEAKSNPQRRQLVEDYSYWFSNWPADCFTETGYAPALPFEPQPARLGRESSLKALVRYGLCGVMYGVVLGSLLGAVEGTTTGMWVGAVIVGFVGCWAGRKYGMVVELVNRVRYGSLAGGTLGTVAGAVVGALIGAMAVALPGTLGGGLVGGLLGRLVKRNGTGSWLGSVIGAGVGAVGWAFYWDQEAALAGVLQGAWMGAGAGMFLVLAEVVVRILAARNRSPW